MPLQNRATVDVTLHRETGELVVAVQTVGPRLGETEFQHSELGIAAKKIQRSAPVNHYEVWRQVSPETEIGLTLTFAPNSPLKRISAQFVKLGIRGSPWSKAKEDEIKAFHDQWLNEQLGDPPYEFRWGKVLSVIEPHWYSSNIVIRYR